MARRKRKAGRNIATYEHPDKERVNNPPVGLVTRETDRELPERVPEIVWPVRLDQLNRAYLADEDWGRIPSSPAGVLP